MTADCGWAAAAKHQLHEAWKSRAKVFRCRGMRPSLPWPAPRPATGKSGPACATSRRRFMHTAPSALRWDSSAAFPAAVTGCRGSDGGPSCRMQLGSWNTPWSAVVGRRGWRARFPASTSRVAWQGSGLREPGCVHTWGSIKPTSAHKMYNTRVVTGHSCLWPFSPSF